MPEIDVNAKQQTQALKNIERSLTQMNKGQETLAKKATDDARADLKKKTSATPADSFKKAAEKQVKAEEKEMGALRKTFGDAFGGMTEIFKKPGGLMKSFGMMAGSPVLMLLGDKMEDLKGKYDENRAEAASREEEHQDEMIEEMKKSNDYEAQKQKLSFLDEAKDDQALAVNMRTNELLEDGFANLEKQGGDGKDGKDGGILSKLKGGLMGMLGLGGGAAGVGIIGKLLGGGKGLMRLLGKAALPLLAISGGIDFAKGWSDASKISGKEDPGIADKFEAGIANALSGLTFGLISPETIYKGVDWFVGKMKDFFTAPFRMILDIMRGEDPIKAIGEYFSSLTFGLLSGETISNAITWMKDKLLEFFTDPFGKIAELIKNIDWMGLLTDTLGTENAEFIAEKAAAVIENIRQKIKNIIDIITAPIDAIKDVWNSLFGELDEETKAARAEGQRLAMEAANRGWSAAGVMSMKKKSEAGQAMKDEKIRSDANKMKLGVSHGEGDTNIVEQNNSTTINSDQDMSIVNDDWMWNKAVPAH